MTLEGAYQEFYDDAFHKSMKPDISDDAKSLAMVALLEKIERENPKPLTWDEMKRLNEVPVYILDLYDEGREGWYILSWDYRKSGQYLVLSSRHCNGFLSDEYGESWVAYTIKPMEV